MASEAEVRFKLGDRTTWDQECAKLEENGRPATARAALSPEEIGSLATHPPYVTWELLNAPGEPCSYVRVQRVKARRG